MVDPYEVRKVYERWNGHKTGPVSVFGAASAQAGEPPEAKHGRGQGYRRIGIDPSEDVSGPRSMSSMSADEPDVMQG